MDIKDARAWLRGERSTTNLHMRVEGLPETRNETLVAIDRSDAALTEQAYWIVRAHKEALLDGEPEGEIR